MGIAEGVDKSYDGQMESRSPLGYLSLPIDLHKTRIAGTTSSKGSVMTHRSTTSESESDGSTASTVTGGASITFFWESGSKKNCWGQKGQKKKKCARSVQKFLQFLC